MKYLLLNIIFLVLSCVSSFAQHKNSDRYYNGNTSFPMLFKTNLLYDVATGLNIEAESPISNKWSLSGEWIFPWWKNTKAKFTMQLLYGNGTIKYWLNRNNLKDKLLGWNIGLNGGGGKYDFQLFNKNGAQGSFYNISVVCGYSHRIGERLNLEYSFGVGYISTGYTKYSLVNTAEHGDIKLVKYPWNKYRRNIFSPTSIKLSLIWLVFIKW